MAFGFARFDKTKFRFFHFNTNFRPYDVEAPIHMYDYTTADIVRDNSKLKTLHTKNHFLDIHTNL